MNQKASKFLFSISLVSGSILIFSIIKKPINFWALIEKNKEKEEVIIVYNSSGKEIKKSKLALADNKKDLKSDEKIAYIQKNYTYQLCHLQNQWALENDGHFQKGDFSSVIGIDMDVQKSWKIYPKGKKEVIIAVVDTGIDYNHKDLKDVIWKNKNEIENDNIDNDENGYEDDIYGWNFFHNNNDIMEGQSENNHGTHIAGIIAARGKKNGVLGIASHLNIKIMSVKVLGGEGGIGTTYSIAKGIQYAEKMGASICNLSISIKQEDEYLKEVIKESKMLFIAAAGNGDKNQNGINLDILPQYPAAYSFDNLITVANIEPDGKLHKSSNYGIEKVDIAAPGIYIYSTITDNQYAYMHGTSMASPMVTGVAAIISSYYKEASSKQIKEILLDTVKPVKQLEKKVKTGGIPSAYQALIQKRYQYLASSKKFLPLY